MDEADNSASIFETDYCGWLLENDVLDYDVEFKSLQGMPLADCHHILPLLRPQLGCLKGTARF